MTCVLFVVLFEIRTQKLLLLKSSITCALTLFLCNKSHFYCHILRPFIAILIIHRHMFETYSRKFYTIVYTQNNNCLNSNLDDSLTCILNIF
jgi:hypothetical protein